MQHAIVFLDRESVDAKVRRPAFPHSYKEYQSTWTHDEIVERTRVSLASRRVPLASDSEIASGAPIFLAQLVGVLREQQDHTSSPLVSTSDERATAVLGEAADRRGDDMLRAGLSVAQVIEGYGDVCQAITDEAHRHGKLTAAHCACAQSVTNCLDAGVDMIVHCVFTEADGSYRARQDLVDRLAKAEVWVNPTLYILRAAIKHLTETRERQGELSRHQEWLLAWTKRELEVRLEAVGRMIRADVRVVAGSDSPWNAYAPGGFSYEIETMGQAGLSNGDAIVSGTAAAAESIGAGDAAGRLAPSRGADVLVVAGDPTRDLAALRHVLDIYQGGCRVERGGR